MSIGKEINIKVNSIELDSSEPVITVNAGEIYEISVNANQFWCDSFVRTSPDGFFNPLLLLSGRRLKGVKCLCGTINADENNHFKIGSGIHLFTMPQSGKLFFFANDSIKHYSNNSGSISLVLKRIS